MKKLAIALIFLFASSVFAQDITNTLASGGYFYVKDAVNTYFKIQQSNGRVGIGSNVAAPRASLEIGGYDGLLVTGTANTGTVTALGAGVRLHWYPRKGAFRVGMAETSYWDDNGSSVTNMALYSIGMGYQVRATATASTAIGAYNKATGDYALSLGSYSQATASHAIAIGTQVYASGIYSVALGSGADTNGRDGSFVFGDDTYFQTAYASADNQLTMRFSGGYRFWSSYPDSTAGVYMRHGQSGWSNYCDRNKKENFIPVDGELILSKIKSIPISEWNYKKTDVNDKYIGPMAQDFYAAFHLNGTDSLGINSISIDGVNMAAVQALEKRTSEMKNEYDRKINSLTADITRVNEENKILMAENKKISMEFSKYKDELAQIKNLRIELEEQVRLAKAQNEKSGVVSKPGF